MAIDLDKMLSDLSGSGEDIKVLALGTLLQCDFGPIAHEIDKLMALKDYLEGNPDAFPGDMGFLYRQVVEKFRDSPLLMSSGEFSFQIDTDSMVTAAPPSAGVRLSPRPEETESSVPVSVSFPSSSEPPAAVDPFGGFPAEDSKEELSGFGAVASAPVEEAAPGGDDPFAALSELPVAPSRVFTQPEPAPTPIESMRDSDASQQTPAAASQYSPSAGSPVPTSPLVPGAPSFDVSPESFDTLLSLPPKEQVPMLLAIKKAVHRKSYPRVKELLSTTSDGRVLATCISALGAIGTKNDVPPLRPYLGHNDSRVRANCIDAIGRIGSPLQILLFVAPMTRDFNQRARNNANRCLATLGREAIVKLLYTLLSQEDVNLRKNAIYAIDNFQGPDVLKLLAKALTDKSQYIRMEVLNVLGKRREPAVKELIHRALGDPHPSVKNLAATLLKGYDSRKPASSHRVQLQGMVDSLDPDGPLPDLSLLSGNDVSVQVETLKKVAEQYTDEAYDYVCQLLDDTQSTELIVHSLKALTAIGGRQDFDRIRKFLDSSKTPVCLAAINAISQLGAPQDLLTYLTPVLRSESAEIRDGAMRQLMRFNPKILLGHFNKLLQANNLAVKITAIYALSCFSGDPVQKMLTSVSTIAHPEIQFNLARALRNRKNQWAVDILSRLATNPDNRISLAARSSLAHLRGEQSPQSGAVISESESVQETYEQGQTSESALSASSEDTAESKPLSAITDISNLEEAKATESVSEDDLLSKSFVGNLADLVSTSPTMSTLFGKLSDKKSSAMKELSELDKKQRVVYEKMGKVVYGLCEKGELHEPDFTKTVFVIKKHLTARKKKEADGKGESGGFLASLLGGSDTDGSASGTDVALKQQYVYLGKTAYRLKQANALTVPQLKEFYLDIQALEERISQLMKEG